MPTCGVVLGVFSPTLSGALWCWTRRHFLQRMKEMSAVQCFQINIRKYPLGIKIYMTEMRSK
ncbi:hypothetical protein D3C72_2441240 [compost metagenome]